MVSRYHIFCKVIELGSFTKAAEVLGYSQSAISQTIKSLEQEVGVTLVDRKKDGIRLTTDGAQYFPYFQAISVAGQALLQKQREMNQLENSVIRIGTFTSVSRNLLPQLMKTFREAYPNVGFVLLQGDYATIAEWVREGRIDFGFVHADAVSGIEMKELYQDEMMAVLPVGHPLAGQNEISLHQLTADPFILLDEGDYSVPMTAFQKEGLSPQVAYKVYDDYTILAMVGQGLGVSILYQRVVTGFEHDVVIRPIKEVPRRIVALTWQNQDTMPYAARQFVDYIVGH